MYKLDFALLVSAYLSLKYIWKYYAVLPAILAKIGIKNVGSSLATAICTCVILLLTWMIVLLGNDAAGIKGLTKISRTFLILPGVATGLCRFFYFKALQLGDASKVVLIDKLNVVFTILLSFLIFGENRRLESDFRKRYDSRRLAGYTDG